MKSKRGTGANIGCEHRLMRISAKVTAGLLAAALVAGAAFVLGRVSAPDHPAKQPGDYFAGLRAGEAQGRREGRGLQIGAELPRNQQDAARHAFDAGYAAGANDVFAGYDGGWAVDVPWIVTIAPGTGQIVYRIDTREQVRRGVNYYLCADGHSICQQPRR